MTELVTAAMRRAKLQSNRHHLSANQHFTCSLDALPVAQPTVSQEGKDQIFMTKTKTKTTGYQNVNKQVVNRICSLP